MLDLLHTVLGWLRDPGTLIDGHSTAYAYGVLSLVVFLETGALVAFLPGDSLLVVAGTYAAAAANNPDAKLQLSLVLLNVFLIPAAIIGDATSYVIGSRLGSALYNRPDSRFFKRSHLEAARAFYEKHGGKAIIIARFMPLVRTFVPVVAGAAKMPYSRFATFNVVGGVAWVTSMTVTGYVLGQLVPNIGKHVEKVIIVVVFLSILPGIIGYLRRKKAPADASVVPSNEPGKA
ncbi:MAG: VTT domain-containing protein [Myxococcaceae bacterium]|jgi:membrane-associated protein|nr:VTT domain-containing protein [Myxococcaceae bacterium]MCA3013214.1 VTT domain-containing protein [Myxococcaceae bacterium]